MNLKFIKSLGIVGTACATVFFAFSVATTPPLPASADVNGICVVVPSPAPTVLPGGIVRPACNASRRLQVDVISGGGGGGGGGGSVTDAGVNGTVAQAVQGITGGIPQTVGARTRTVTVVPTVTASSAYAAGNSVGGLLTFTNAFGPSFSGRIESARITTAGVQTSGFKLYLFSANPSASTWTDKVTPSINAADVILQQDVIPFAAPDSGLGTTSLWAYDGIGKAINSASTSLFGVLVTTGTPTYSISSSVTVSLNITQD